MGEYIKYYVTDIEILSETRNQKKYFNDDSFDLNNQSNNITYTEYNFLINRNFTVYKMFLQM